MTIATARLSCWQWERRSLAFQKAVARSHGSSHVFPLEMTPVLQCPVLQFQRPRMFNCTTLQRSYFLSKTVQNRLLTVNIYIQQGCKRDLGVRDRDETETFDFQSETRPRPRPSHTLPRPRRDRDRDVERPRPRLFSRRWHFGLPK